MNTRLGKKGRIGIAWMIIITMVFATMYTPFAMAADVPGFNVYGITKDGASQSQYVIDGENDFVFIKQATAEKMTYVLWTRTTLSEAQNHEIIDSLLASLGDTDNSINDLYIYADDKKTILGVHYDWVQYFSTFNTTENPTFDVRMYNPVQDKYGDPYSYTFTEVDGKIVLDALTSGTISHIYYGQYDELSATAQIVLNKSLTGAAIADYDGDFEFSLIETDSSWEPLTDAVAVKAYNDETGKITFPSVTYKVAKTYYYQATETEGTILGITYDKNPINIEVVVGMDGDVLKATVIIDPEETEKTEFTNTYTEEEVGSIEVTKTVTVPTGATFEEDMTFTFALFDESDMIIEGITPITITVKKPAEPGDPLEATTGTFTDLPLDKVYTVYEVYKDGEVYKKVEIDEKGLVLTPGMPWKSMSYTDNKDIEVNAETAAKVTVNNVLPSEEGGLTGSIKVVKTVTVNKKPFASKLTFYVGLFPNKELTDRIAYQPIIMGGLSEKIVYFDDLDAGTYYIAETDKDGNPLTGTAKELGFEIQINGDDVNNATVELIEDEVTVNLVNNFKKEEFPLTGDNSNMNLWLFLAMLGVAGAIAPFAFRKKEEAND